MRKLFFPLLLYVFVIACDNTIEINSTLKEETIVYGLLDIQDSVHYIRIEKSFLQDNISGLVLAADPANLYYPDSVLTGYVEEWKDNVFIEKYDLEKVDGDTIGIPKQEGIFASSPNILYRFKKSLDADATYKFYAILNEKDTVSASTVIVHPYEVFYPTISGAFINYTDTTKIGYLCRHAVNGKIYELWMHVHYYEKNYASGDSVLKTVDWQIFKNLSSESTSGEGNLLYSLRRQSFYSFMSNNIPDDENVRRYFSSMNFSWYAGGQELWNLYLNELANLGINEFYISPEYTNVKNGLGIFSSICHIEVDSVYLDNLTVDTLACGHITDHLHFASNPENPYYPDCE